MWKWVVRDYFAAFRWGKINEWLKSNNGWWFLLYFGVFFPSILELWSSELHTLVYFIMMLSIMFCVFSTACHPIGLPKVMYLCPMEQEKRKEYIVKSCLFRMLMIVLLELLVAILLLILGVADGVTACMIVGDGIFWAIASSGLGHQRMDERTRERLKALTSYAMGGIAAGLLIITGLSLFFLLCIICWDSSAWWLKWIVVTVALLFQLPMAILLLKRWDDLVERTVSYEKSYL